MLSFIFGAALLAATAPSDSLVKNVFKTPPFVRSVIAIDTTAHTATFPLYKGLAGGKTVWYILTDASDKDVAKARGLDYAPDLANASDAIVGATEQDGAVVFRGAPDFSPTRTVVPSAGGFPPKSATPGGVANADYSPFIRIAGQPGVLNAPIVATGDGPFDVTTHANTHDRAIAIDTAKGTVTLALARGFADGKPVYYVSTEANDPVAAAVERATYAPRLAKASVAATIPIGVVIDGPSAAATGQGLAFLTLHTPIGDDATVANAATIGSPFNVLSLVPDLKNPYGENGYSPLWSVYVLAKESKRATNYAAVAAASPTKLLVNCPAIAFGDDNEY